MFYITFRSETCPFFLYRVFGPYCNIWPGSWQACTVPPAVNVSVCHPFSRAHLTVFSKRNAWTSPWDTELKFACRWHRITFVKNLRKKSLDMYKGGPGSKFVPGVGKFFLASNLDPPPPSPAIYSNFAREISFFGHHVIQNM